MQISTFFYLVLALVTSVIVAYFQYFYKVKSKSKINYFLFSLKLLSLFLLLLLIINPTIKKTELENHKPILSLLADNSLSISFFKENENVKDLVNKINKDKELKNKFDIQNFKFDNTLKDLDSLSFNENETDINKAIKTINELNIDKISPIVLLTDGNQTIGDDYQYLNSKKAIYPIVIGDTTVYSDLKISQINVNKYSFVKNKFPVEIFINYNGLEDISSKIVIQKNGKTVFSKNIKLNPKNNSKSITAYLTSEKEGLQYYKATIHKIKGEKNTNNNSKTFSVDVINQQTKVLILTSILHPDIGAVKKAIESNKQRSVSVFLVENFNLQLSDFQLIILYQPNNKFNNIFNILKSEKLNFLIHSGAKTDWNFINKNQLGVSKNAILQTENYGAFLNDSFLPFTQNDIGFNQFPPLKDKFGKIVFSKEQQTLLYQNINGIKTDQPLFATIEENNQKIGILFGEGLWKWRAASFLNSNSFKDFDNFTSNIVQYLASNKKRERLEVTSKNLYSSSSIVSISAFYTDKNYKFDKRANLEIAITNLESKKVTKFPFSLLNNSFKAEIEDLPSGNYSYTVSVNNQNNKKFGTFKITDFNIEEQFVNAASNKLIKLASNSNGKAFYKDQFNDLKNELLTNKSYYTTQKSTIKEQNLIDWKWVLFIIVSLFTIEWFTRKYYGKI